MKALVLEIKGKHAMVLTEDGVMQKIKYSGSVGDEIEVGESRIAAFRQYRKAGTAAVAAAAAVVLGILGYDHVYVEPTTFISIDGNSSFEYEVNRQNQVVAIKPIGEDAEALVSKLNDSNIKGKSVSEALDITASVMAESGYLDGADDHISVTVTGTDSKQVESLTNTVTAAVEQKKSIALDVKTATMDQRAQAMQSGVSTGQYLAESGGQTSSGTAASPSGKKKTQEAEELSGTAVAASDPGKETPSAGKPAADPAASSKPSVDTGTQGKASSDSAGPSQGKASSDTAGSSSRSSTETSSPSGTERSVAVSPDTPSVPVEPSTEASPETDATAAINPEILAAQAAEEAAQKIALEAAQAAEEAARAAEKIAQEAAEAAKAAEAAAASVTPDLQITETPGAAENPTVPDASSMQAPGVQLEDQ